MATAIGAPNERPEEPPEAKRKSAPLKEPEAHLFTEINALRNPAKADKSAADQDEIERLKLNDTMFGKLAGSKKFEYTTLSVIVLNAGFIGYDADFSARNHKPENLYDCEDYGPGACYQFIVMENFFAVYFTAEVVIRFFSYRRKCDMCTDAWFLFDSVLVAFMVVETWVLPVVGSSGPLAQLSVLRLLRLLRITRMAKLMRFFPELQIIVKGMVAAVRSVVCTAILLILILYVFSILFTSEFHQGDRGDDEVTGAHHLFGSMGKSMRHLFIMGTILDDITLCTNSIRGSNKNVTMLIAFIVFVLMSSFTMLNMLIGILCEVVCATGEGERNKNTEAHVREAITTLFNKMDKDQNGLITREEFMSMKEDKNVMKALVELEVKAKHFEMYADLMFKPEDGGSEAPSFDFNKVLNMIMRLRPGTKVSALDFASFQMTVYKNHDSLKKNIANVEQLASALSGQDLTAPTMSKPNSRAGSKKQVLQEEPPSKLTVSALPQLDKAPDQEILAELQRRIGSFTTNGHTPLTVEQTSDKPPAKIVEAFPTHVSAFGPPDMEAWSKDTYNY